MTPRGPVAARNPAGTADLGAEGVLDGVGLLGLVAVLDGAGSLGLGSALVGAGVDPGVAAVD
ncbi:MAG TPA: hypothetical protein VGD71_06135 [Kribbella sp.]